MKTRSMAVGAACIALSCGVAQTAFAKEIKVRVLNCLGYSIQARAYNPNDFYQQVEYEAENIKNGNERNLKCSAQGKGYCLIDVYKLGGSGVANPDDFKLHKERWLKLYWAPGHNFTVEEHTTRPSCPEG